MLNAADFLKELNPIQQRAVQAIDGPVLILAGAGSGKTRVLTYRVAYLIACKQAAPESILTVTFTNKAAQEMRERIIHLIGKSQQPIMGTFHSICARLLRKEAPLLGLPPGFTIYDENDALDAIKEALTILKIDPKKTSPTAVRYIISGAKNENISDLEYPQYAKGYFQETAAKVYLEYQKILRANQALDFDDLIMYVIRLFLRSPETLHKYQNQFRYILVDEYQDTNPTQYILVKMLAQRFRNLCVVGDASQSIYSFRGADFRNIVNFQRDYKDTRVFNLEQNYRSTQIILDAAHAVVSANKSHPILNLWTDKKTGQKIKIFQARSEVDEAMFVIDEIKASKKPFNDFAILYRTNAQSRSLEEAFLKSGIPYALVGGLKFYERKEIKDVLAYLRLIANPKDSVSRRRIEKIGIKRAQKFDQLSDAIPRMTMPATLELMEMILETTNYLETLDDGTEQGKLRIENVKELKSVAKEFPDLVDFLENVALVQDTTMPNGDIHGAAPRMQVVTLMTIHASKGLEFPTVFLVGMEEGLFPHSRAMLDPNQMEEERRLAYVGITRAKEKLYMIYTRSRLYFGQRSNNLVSRFLSAIPEKLLDQSTGYRESKDYYSVDDDIYRSSEDEWI